MPAITPAERAFLSQEWRFAEVNDPALKARHASAREAEYAGNWITLAGANAAIQIIHAAVSGNKRVAVATVDAVLERSFRQRPRTVRLLTSRFGNNTSTGRLMAVERMDVDHGARRTTLYLTG